MSSIENNNESGDADAHQVEPHPTSLHAVGKSATVPLVVGIVVSVITFAAVIWFSGQAAETDHQAVFFRCLSVGLLGGICAAISFHVAARRSDLPWLVPGMILTGIVLFFGLLRFESFSGEMIPQFSWRFGSAQAPPPMQTSVQAPQPASQQLQDTENVSSDKEGSSTAVFSAGFLGNARTGIISDSFPAPLSPDDFEVLWNIGIGGGWGSFAVSDQLAITLEQRDDQEWVTAYDLDSGELRWKHEYDAYHFNPLGGLGPRSTPQIDGDAVYTQGATGTVKCLSLQDGAVRWEVDLLDLAKWTQEESEAEIAWGRSGSPLIVDGLCVVPMGAPSSIGQQTGRSLIALDQNTGETVWISGTDQISYASAQLIHFDGPDGDAIPQIVIVNESTISGHATDDGRVLWTTTWEGDSNGGANCASVIPAGKNSFLIGKGYGGGSAWFELRPEGEGWSVEAIWESPRLMKTKFNHAIVVDDVCFGISNGALESVRLSTAERLWIQSRRERCGQGQAILAGSTLIVQNESGDLTIAKAVPDQYEELFRVPALSSKTWNIPTLAGNYLLVRNDRQAICFRVGTTLIGDSN